MGIKQLNKMIKRVSPRSLTEKSVRDLYDKKVAIDSSIYIYKFRYGSNDTNDLSHLNGFFQKTCYFLKNGILPVYVFDGVPPIEKRLTLNKRTRQKDKIKKKMEILQKQYSTLQITDEHNVEKKEPELNEQEIKFKLEKLSRQITYVNNTHRKECKYFLRLLGIPIIESESEAEKTCANLQEQGYVDYTFTEDTDALTFGAPKVIKTMRDQYTHESLGKRFVEVDLHKVIEDMELTMDEFIDFCILCGCDYCPTIPSIGPITALHLIRTYSNIETVLENLHTKYKVPEHFHYEKARRIFKTKTNMMNVSSDINVRPIQYKKLCTFLEEEKGCTKNFVYNWLQKYNESLLSYYQRDKVFR